MALNVNSKVKDLLANPECVKVLEKYMPGMTTNPGLKAAYGMSLKALLAFPQTKCSKENAAAITKDLEALGL
jgi:hypothetical protein